MARWEIVNVPEHPPCSLATVLVLAAAVDPRSANDLVRKLGQIAPLENLRHVKRVRKRLDGGKSELHVILCLIAEGENFMTGVPLDVAELIGVHKLNPFPAQVAKFAASTKDEWHSQCKLWPTSYHPPCNIDGITGFSEEDSKLICSFMKIAMGLSKIGQLHEQVVNSAIIVDPTSRQIISSATDEVSRPTSRKESSIVNEGIADLHESVSDLESTELSPCRAKFLESSNAGVACLYPWRWTELGPPSQETCKHHHSWHPLRHAALVAIEVAAARDCRLFPNSRYKNGSSLEVEMLPFSDNHLSKRQKMTSEIEAETPQSTRNCQNSLLSRPYLCTGFDIYLVWEPCMMCAMALVHQRIRRIFFAIPNPNTGALGSVHRLHGEKSLNHHYTVFRIIIPADTSG